MTRNNEYVKFFSQGLTRLTVEFNHENCRCLRKSAIPRDDCSCINVQLLVPMKSRFIFILYRLQHRIKDQFRMNILNDLLIAIDPAPQPDRL